MRKWLGESTTQQLLMFLVTVLVFWLVVRSAPVYYKHYRVTQALTEMVNHTRQMSVPDQYVRDFESQLRIKGVAFDPRLLHISFTPNEIEFSLDYQEKRHFIYNVDLLFTFHVHRSRKVSVS